MGSLTSRIADWYFQPRDFEKSGKIYEYSGVSLFSKYFINQGSFWNKLFGKKRIKGHSEQDLDKFIGSTKLQEAIHMGIAGFLAVPAIAHLCNGEYKQAAIAGTLSVLGGIVPALSQRYNRNRLNSIAEKRAKKRQVMSSDE